MGSSSSLAGENPVRVVAQEARSRLAARSGNGPGQSQRRKPRWWHPRAGIVSAAQIFAERGDARQAYDEPEAIAAPAGLVPVTNKSGKHEASAPEGLPY